MSGPYRAMLIAAVSVVVIGCLLGVLYNRYGIPGELPSPGIATPPVKMPAGDVTSSSAPQPNVEQPGSSQQQENTASGGTTPPSVETPQAPVGPEAPAAPPAETKPQPAQPEQPAPSEPAPAQPTQPAPEEPKQPATPPPSGGVSTPQEPAQPESPKPNEPGTPNSPGDGNQDNPTQPNNPIISENGLQLVSWYTSNGHEVHILMRDVNRAGGVRNGTLRWELTTAGGTSTNGTLQYSISPYNSRDTNLFLVRYIPALAGQTAHCLLHFSDNKGRSEFWFDTWLY